MPMLNMKPSPVCEEVKREREREEKMEQSNEGMTLLGHALGFGLFSEIAEMGNASSPSSQRRYEGDEINIDPRARLNPSKSFMPR